MKIDVIRKYAMSLEAVTEEPHHYYSPFCVRGKILVTIPQDDAFIHVFVGEADSEPVLAMHAVLVEKLRWGYQGNRPAQALQSKEAAICASCCQKFVAGSSNTGPEGGRAGKHGVSFGHRYPRFLRRHVP